MIDLDDILYRCKLNELQIVLLRGDRKYVEDIYDQVPSLHNSWIDNISSNY